ncbi:arylformamidase [Ignatzschineria indica]|uniref:BD-FAE-like domain-containing protein n=1 Tax=Ignatzschineria indica TaxID=472583 RepID=A0A2U2ALV4_9GAMM|nr:alpha/beta hydrolase [Ignatzschineria indica]PWD84116.1 hypothetical protein DC082_00785 [Ignatzschineria indica]GGZ73976.1 arylformamidase [Ignatzschineria indica]
MKKRYHYDNSATVADEGRILDDFKIRSKIAYERYPHIFNCSYLTKHDKINDKKALQRRSFLKDRATYDLFLNQKESKGTILFIHGGYWQWCDKTDFAFIAQPILAAGYHLLLIEYPLAPTATLTEINRAITIALDYLYRYEKRIDQTQPTLLIGHSAGAHLAALNANHPLIDEVWLLSGLYQLESIAKSHLNRALQLSPKEIELLSPQSLPAPMGKEIKIIVGQNELPELIYQSLTYHQKLSTEGAESELILLPSDHYTILDDLFNQLDRFSP